MTTYIVFFYLKSFIREILAADVSSSIQANSWTESLHQMQLQFMAVLLKQQLNIK
jgi:hypothetical protein